MTILYSIFLSLFLLQVNAEYKTIKFSFASPSKINVDGVVSVLPEPSVLIVTIQDRNGNVVVNRKALSVYRNNEDYFSFPLSIKSEVGDQYILTEALVLDSEHRLIYAAPKVGSKVSRLVSNPLDIKIILDEATTIVSIDVLDLIDKVAGDFGFINDDFSALTVKHVDLSVYIKGVRNFEMIESHLVIEGISEGISTANVLWTFETNLEARTYVLKLRQAPAYRLIVSRVGFTTVTRIVNSQRKIDKVAIKME